MEDTSNNKTFHIQFLVKTGMQEMKGIICLKYFCGGNLTELCLYIRQLFVTYINSNRLDFKYQLRLCISTSEHVLYMLFAGQN